MSPSRKITLLIATNIFSLGFAGSILWSIYRDKQIEKERQEQEAQKPYLFTDNPQYVEQTDFYTLFTTKANIVMLGNSHMYRMHWDELLDRKDVVNRGIGSDITEGYLSRMSSVLSVQPKICFIEGGGNDIDLRIPVPVDTIVANIHKVVVTLKEHHIKPVLTALFYASKDYPLNDSNKYNHKVAALNIQLHRLAKADSVSIIDINMQLNEAEYLKEEYARKDGIHLSSKAYSIWKAEIDRLLKEEGL